MAVTERPTVIWVAYACMPETINASSRNTHRRYHGPPRSTRRMLPAVNREKRWTVVLTRTSRSVEVEELRHGVQVFLQHHDALVLDDVADLAVGIEQVPEL